MRGILQGLASLEELHIIHRDIKFSNIALKYADSTICPVIVDFGFSIREIDANSHTKKFGTIGYYAPEILKSQPFDCRADVYSAGILMFNVYSGGII